MTNEMIDDSTLLMAPLLDMEHMQAWFQHFLGFTLPDCRVSKYATSTPADFVWTVYQHIMQGKPLHIMALSGRDSSKTVSLSAIDLLAILHDRRAALHSAMTKAQANRAREYLQSYILKQPLLRQSLVKENSSILQLNIGGDEVGLELISLTPKAVQGAHYALVSVDELASSLDPMQIKAYRDLSGVPGTDKLSGKPAVIVKITSRQSGNSLAESEIKNAHKSGIQVESWTTIDCMQKCTEDRCGTTPVPMNVNIIKGQAYTDQEFQALSPSEQEGFERTTDTRDGCLKCPLLQYCQGRARFQTSDSVLLRSIDDVIGKVNASSSHEWVLSQIMSLQPSSEGLVYPEFSPLIHVPAWEDLWETLTGEIPNRSISRADFIGELKRRGATFVAGVDWGYAHPATCVVVAVDKKGVAYIVEALGMVRKNDLEWVDIIKTKIQPKYDVQMYCPDSENPSGKSLLRNADLPVADIDKGPGSVKAGVNVVKGMLKVAGTNNLARLFICPDIRSSSTENPGLIEEFGLYAKEVDASGQILDDKIIKSNDHYMDALRYVLYWYFGKSTFRAVFASQEPIGLSNERFVSPGGLDLARIAGINVNDNRDEFSRLGHQNSDGSGGTDDDDPNNKGGGGGGGLMVAWT